MNYLTTDTTGSLIHRHASVPFNPAGDFCISGLGFALREADEGRGARGSRFVPIDRRHIAKYFQFIKDSLALEGCTSSLIKNLTLALDPAHGTYEARKECFEWERDACHFIVAKLPNLKTVSLVSEGVLDRRKHLSQKDFENLHQTTSFGPEFRTRDTRQQAWNSIMAKYRHQQNLFEAITQFKIDSLERSESQYLDGLGSTDDATKAA